MKRTMKTLIVLCLVLVLLVGMSSGIAAATAESVWVNGVLMVDGDYLPDNDSTTVTAGATEEPATYVAWYHSGTLALNDINIVNGYSAEVYKRVGTCGIYASGDLIIDLSGDNYIRNTSNGLTGGIVINGQLNITSNEEGKIQITANRIGILCNNHDLTVSGDVDISVTSSGDSVDISSGIMSALGDVVICESAKVDAYAHENADHNTVSAIYAYDGNIRILDQALVRAESCSSSSDSISSGIAAIKVLAADSGNINCSGSVDVTAVGYYTALSASETLTVANNAYVSAWAIRYGIGNTKNVNISNGYLEIYGGDDCGAAVLGKPNWNLTDSVLGLVGTSSYNCYPAKEISPIYFDSGENTYYYQDGDVIQAVCYMFYRPKYEADDFTDCGKWAWAMPYNYFIIENSIMGSVYNDSNYFDSNGTVTRGMVVAVMYRLCGSPELSQADYDAYNNKFTDVEKGQWYYDPVVWAYNNGVTEGKTSTTFAPSEKTSREQIVAFFWRFCDHLGYDNSGDNVLNGYSDLNKVSTYALDAFRWSVTYGIVNGTSNTELSPRSPCTRGQMARIIYGFVWSYMDDQDWISMEEL